MGSNKAFLSYSGRPFVHILIELLKTSFSEVFLIGKDGAPYANLRIPFLKDVYPLSGAAVGVLTGLQGSTNDWMFFCAVDMPLIDPAILNLLTERLVNQKKQLAIVPRINGQLEPLCAIYHRRFAEMIRLEMKAGKTPSLRGLLELGSVHVVDVPPPKAFALSNVNTPSDYAELLRILPT